MMYSARSSHHEHDERETAETTGHVTPKGALLKREDYPFFSDEDFEEYKKFNKEKLDEYHLENKRKYVKRIKNYSLPGNFDIKCSYSVNDTRDIVMYGKTGDGKSSTANTILGKYSFNVSRSSHSETASSTEETGSYKNRKIKVVDTPGVHDTKLDYETVSRELKKVAFLLRDGVHCSIICMKASDSKFTKDTEEMLKIIKIDDPQNFPKFCMLALTNAESELKKCSLEELLESKKRNTHFKDFIESISYRVVAVDNTTDIPAERERNREAIIAMVDKVVRDNEPDLYTNKLFQLAGKLYNELKSVVTTNNYPPELVDEVIEAVIALSNELETTTDIETSDMKEIQSKCKPNPPKNISRQVKSLLNILRNAVMEFLQEVIKTMKRLIKGRQVVTTLG